MNWHHTKMTVLLWIMAATIGSVTGFTEFYDMPDSHHCQSPFAQQIDAAVVSSSQSYQPTSDCRLKFEAQEFLGERKQLLVRFFDLSITDCQVNLELYYGSDRFGTPDVSLGCHDSMPPDVLIPGKYLTIWLPNTMSASRFTFKFHVTAYEQAGSCDGFLCDNNKCINSFLKCDGTNNCLDDDDTDGGSDEETSCSHGDFSWVIQAVVVLAVIVIIVIVVVILVRRRRLARGTIINPPGQMTTTTYVHSPAMAGQPAPMYPAAQTHAPPQQPASAGGCPPPQGYPPSQAGGYQQGGYPPAQGYPPPPQHGYPPPQQGYPPPQQGNPPPQQGYPPPQQGLPPSAPGYPPPAQVEGGYPGPTPIEAGYPGPPPSAPPAQAGGYAPMTYPSEEKVPL